MAGVLNIANRATNLAYQKHLARLAAAQNARVAAISLAQQTLDGSAGAAIAAADTAYFQAAFASEQRKQQDLAAVAALLRGDTGTNSDVAAIWVNVGSELPGPVVW
jgi:hypothetical protein